MVEYCIGYREYRGTHMNNTVETPRFKKYDARSYSYIEVLTLAQQYLNVRRTRNENTKRQYAARKEMELA